MDPAVVLLWCFTCSGNYRSTLVRLVPSSAFLPASIIEYPSLTPVYHQRPLKLALRFSRKAVVPSVLSSVAKHSPKAAISKS